jgi:hypothetical protein
MRGAVEFIIPVVPYYGLFSTVTELPKRLLRTPLFSVKHYTVLQIFWNSVPLINLRVNLIKSATFFALPLLSFPRGANTTENIQQENIKTKVEDVQVFAFKM